MVEPFVDLLAFQVPRPDMEANSPSQYYSDMSTKQGVVADLYDLVPPKLHGMMQYSPFVQKVSIQCFIYNCLLMFSPM